MNRAVQIVWPIFLLLVLFFVPSSILGWMMYYSYSSNFIIHCLFTILIWPIVFVRISIYFINKYNLKHIAFKGSIIVLSIVAVIHEMHMTFLGSHPPVWPYLLGTAGTLADGYFDPLDIIFLFLILGLSLAVLIITYCVAFYKITKTNINDKST